MCIMAKNRILVVDDEKNLVRILKMNLEDNDYEVETAFNGLEALEKISVARPDLIILDVMMPGIDGWEVLSRLRKNTEDRYIPVIVLTSKTTGISKIFGFDLGADDYVTKPFEIDELIARVGAIMRRFLADQSKPKKEVPRIPAIDSFKGVNLVDQEEIVYIDAIHNYTYLHCDNEKYLTRFTLTELEHKLADSFTRIHRSHIINLNKVESVFAIAASSYRVRLNNESKTELPVSRRKIKVLKSRLGI